MAKYMGALGILKFGIMISKVLGSGKAFVVLVWWVAVNIYNPQTTTLRY